MKKSFFAFTLLGLSLGHILNFGAASVQPASAQVFRCSDSSLGVDNREQTRGEDSRSESKVAIGTDCNNANFNEQINEMNRRNAELKKLDMESMEDHMKRVSCEFYGIHSPNCTHEGLRRQAQQEDEIQRKRQAEDDQIRKEAGIEKTLRDNVENARSVVRHHQEQIAFWSDHPDMRQSDEKMLPISEADLQRAEKELQDYLDKKQKR